MRWIAFLCLSLVIVGCKGGPKSVVKYPGPAAIPDGATLAESSDRTVSIMVPPGWNRGGPSSNPLGSLRDMGTDSSTSELPSGTRDLANSMASQDQAAEAEEAAELEKKGILVWVNDSTKPIVGEERTHYSVKLVKDAGASLEQAAQDAKADLIDEGAPTYVELPIGKAARFQTKNIKVDGGELNQILYIIVNGVDIYKVRFATQNGEQAINLIEKPVIDSIRIKPATP